MKKETIDHSVYFSNSNYTDRDTLNCYISARVETNVFFSDGDLSDPRVT